MSPSPSERVLVVEDEPSTRVGLTELVRTWGFTADSAGDGEEALQRITVFRPSIIISDLVMPRRRWFGRTKRSRERESISHRTPNGSEIHQVLS